MRDLPKLTFWRFAHLKPWAIRGGRGWRKVCA